MKKRETWWARVKREDKELVEEMKEQNLEKGDAFAMIIAALITIVPVVLFILAVFVFFVWVLFVRQ